MRIFGLRRSPLLSLTAIVAVLGIASTAISQEIRIVDKKPDPHATPRPVRNAENIPVRTSLYFELGFPKDVENHSILRDSVTVSIAPENGKPTVLLQEKEKFVNGATGTLTVRQGQGGSDYAKINSLAVYIDPQTTLRPSTKYVVRVTAKTDQGGKLDPKQGSWSFTTESAAATQPVSAKLDLKAKPVDWTGQFFSGLCHVWFTSTEEMLGPTNDLMLAAQKKHPRAWTYQRDFWMTGMDRQNQAFGNTLPNIVREKETRHIVEMQTRDDGILLTVEDFFGCEQYGVEANRPLSGDYHKGDVVLIAGVEHDRQATVIAVDDAARTVLVTPFDAPEGGWKLGYDKPLPKQENPDMPGLFAGGGVHLVKLNPHGTAVYYWGRLDKEWDLAHRKYGRRLLVNFADAPGDLARDARNWTAPKDYAQYHETVKVIAGHVIDRYGDEALTFTWSVFNEPDLLGLFWRTDWDELQRFYDYTVDGVLRAFEDRGYDSDKVLIGGLELGAIFPANMRLKELLAHCSPVATAPGALPKNAAFEDKRLDGKRSRRVEELCKKHDGKGTPCDFISIHAYNSSETMVAKLIRTKELALELDPEFYKDLWVSSHECCPEWALPPDRAAADSYLGNGYAETWCMDVVARQLRQAQKDPRYAFGETLFTVWPPSGGFGGANAITRNIAVDDNGDGRKDRVVTMHNPLFHALTLLSDLGNRLYLLPLQQVGGHDVSGFASQDEEGVLRVVLYSHFMQDVQSRSDTEFDVTLEVANPGWNGAASVTEYRIDKGHNSYFEEGVKLRKHEDGDVDLSDLAKEIEDLKSGDPARQLAALERLSGVPVRKVRALLRTVGGRLEDIKDEEVRKKAFELTLAIWRGGAYSASEIEPALDRSVLTPTRESQVTVSPQTQGKLKLNAKVSANGMNFLVVTPEK